MTSFSKNLHWITQGLMSVLITRQCKHMKDIPPLTDNLMREIYPNAYSFDRGRAENVVNNILNDIVNFEDISLMKACLAFKTPAAVKLCDKEDSRKG